MGTSEALRHREDEGKWPAHLATPTLAFRVPKSDSSDSGGG